MGKDLITRMNFRFPNASPHEQFVRRIVIGVSLALVCRKYMPHKSFFRLVFLLYIMVMATVH